MDDILTSLELQHLINNFKQNEVEKVMCLSDKELDQMGVTKPTDRSRLREECLDYVKNTKTIDKVVNDLQDNNIKIPKHGGNYDLIKHHVKKIVDSAAVKNFLQDVKKGIIKLDVNGWVTFAKECFIQLCKYFSDRPVLVQVVIAIVIAIIVAVLGYLDSIMITIPSVILMFLAQIGCKRLTNLNVVSSDILKSLCKKIVFAI